MPPKIEEAAAVPAGLGTTAASEGLFEERRALHLIIGYIVPWNRLDCQLFSIMSQKASQSTSVGLSSGAVAAAAMT